MVEIKAESRTKQKKEKKPTQFNGNWMCFNNVIIIIKSYKLKVTFSTCRCKVITVKMMVVVVRVDNNVPLSRGRNTAQERYFRCTHS